MSFKSGGAILAHQLPAEKAGRLMFRRHPDGILFSVPKTEVTGIAAVSVERPRSLRPNEQLDVGFTGEGASEPEREAGQLPPGAARGLPPLRSKWIDPLGWWWIVGYNVPFPPAPAVLEAPGEPPTGVQTGPPPVRPN